MVAATVVVMVETFVSYFAHFIEVRLPHLPSQP